MNFRLFLRLHKQRILMNFRPLYFFRKWFWWILDSFLLKQFFSFLFFNEFQTLSSLAKILINLRLLLFLVWEKGSLWWRSRCCYLVSWKMFAMELERFQTTAGLRVRKWYRWVYCLLFVVWRKSCRILKTTLIYLVCWKKDLVDFSSCVSCRSHIVSCEENDGSLWTSWEVIAVSERGFIFYFCLLLFLRELELREKRCGLAWSELNLPWIGVKWVKFAMAV